MLRSGVALCCLVVTACSSHGSVQPGRGAGGNAGVDAGSDAAIEAGGDSATVDGAADAPDSDAPTPARPCNDPSSSPTASYALGAWPVLKPVSATDLGAGSGQTSVPGAPAGIVAAANGYVFVALANFEIGVLQQTGSKLSWVRSLSMPAGERPFGLALSRDGTTLAASLSTEVAFINVAALESGAANALVATIPTHSAFHLGIDVAFSADGDFAFVALERDRGVAVVDVKKRAYVGQIPIAGRAVTGAVVSPDGKRLYVTCEVADEFLAANPNPANDQVVGRVTVVDVATAETSPASSIIGQAYVGRAPVRSRVSPDGATLWVTARGSNALVALDTASLVSKKCDPFVSSTAVGPAPVGLAVSADGASVLVANSNRFATSNAPQTVSVVDSARAFASSPDAVTGQYTAGAFPREVAIAGTQAFVTNYKSLSVSSFGLGP